jgi:hypothetical protein
LAETSGAGLVQTTVRSPNVRLDRRDSDDPAKLEVQMSTVETSTTLVSLVSSRSVLHVVLHIALHVVVRRDEMRVVVTSVVVRTRRNEHHLGLSHGSSRLSTKVNPWASLPHVNTSVVVRREL